MFLNRKYEHLDVLTKASITIQIIEDVAIYKAQIFSSNGNVFGTNDKESELHLIIWKGLADITDKFTDIVWRRFTSKTSGYEEDLYWGEKYNGQTSFTLTRDDINERAKIQAEVYASIDGERTLVAVDYINFIDVNDLQGSPFPPTSPNHGDLWLDTSVTPPRLMMWDLNLQQWIEVTVAGKDRRNLIRNSNFYKVTFDNWETIGTPELKIESLRSKKWARIKSNTSDSNLCGIKQVVNNVNVKSNYTFQMLSEVYIQSTAPEGNALVTLYSINEENKKTLLKEEMYDITDTSYVYSTTFATLEDTKKIEVNISGQKKAPFDFIVTNIKLENYPVATEWELAIEDMQDALDNKVGNTHDEIFNSLTDDGRMQGLYVDIDNQGRKNFYFNASYIKTGKLLGEYIEGRNLTVKDDRGNKTFEITDQGEVNIQAKSLKIGINSVATTGDVNTAVDSISVSARNFIRNGNFKDIKPNSFECSNWNAFSEIYAFGAQGQTGYNAYGLAYLASINGGGIYQDISSLLIKPNTQYTLSFDLYLEHNVKKVAVYCEYFGADKIHSLHVEEFKYTANTTNRIKFTTPDIDYKYFRFVFRHDGSYSDSSGYLAVFGLVSIVEGTVSSNWIPAPEDTESAISNIDDKVSTTNNKIVAIEADLNGITQRVQSTESTVVNHSTQISQVDGRVDTVADNLNNLKIGGRNLLLNAGFKKGLDDWETHASCDVIAIADNASLSGYVMKFTSTGDGGIYQRKKIGYYPAGTILTVSGYVKSNTAGKTFDVNFENAGGSNTFKRTVCDNVNTWYYFAYTYTVEWNTFNTVTFYGQTGAEYYLKDLKLEEGNKPTSWIEAPEDIDKNISNIDTKIETTTNKLSELKLETDSITQRVQSTENKVTTVTNNLNNLQIGGRNLLTKDIFENGNLSGPDGSLIDGAVNYYRTKNFIEVDSNKQYTLKINKCNSNDKIEKIIAYTANGEFISTHYIQSTETIFTCPSNCKKIKFICIVNNAQTFSITEEFKIKLERGNRATDYSPAPEDIDNSISSVDSKIETTKNKVAEIVTNIDSITQRVQSTESNVSIVTNNLSNLQIGGRNLCTGTKDWDGNWREGYNVTLTDEYYQGLRIYTAHNQWAYYYQEVELEADTDYTISCWVKTNVAGTHVGCYIWHGDGACITLDETDKWIRYTYTYRNPNKEMKVIRLESPNSINGAIIYLCGLKLEKGNKATDWAPAPEDIDNSISNVQAHIETTTNKLSELKLETDNITQRVQSTESKVTTVTNDFNNLQIGGRNIALGTNQGTGWYWALENGSWSGSEVIENGIRCSKLTRDNTPATGWSYIAYERIGRNKYVAGKKYTVSFEVKASVPAHFACSFLEGNSSNGLTTELVRATVYEANKWTKLVFNVTMKDELPNSTSQILYLNEMNAGAGVSYIFRNLMIEEGTKASAWSPAPEDIYSDIGLVDNKIETTTNKVAEIVTSLDSINLKVQSTEQTVVNHTTQLSQVDSKIDNVESHFNNLQVGGRNLIYKDMFEQGHWWVSGGNTSAAFLRTKDGIDFLPNVDYTISVNTLQINHAALSVVCIVYENGVAYQDKCLAFTSNTTQTFKFDKPWRIYIQDYSGSHILYDYKEQIVKMFKLEKGNKATDWTPAPEDIDNAITSVDSKVETTKNQVASIETNLSGITQRVQSTESTITTHTTQLGQVDNKINNAVNDLQIGGRNLWRFTKEYDGSKYDKWCDNNEGNSDLTPPHTHINGFGVQRIAWAWHDMSQRVPIEPYTNYTLSAWVKWENEIGELMFYTNSGTMNNTNLTSQVGTSDFRRVSITFNSNDGNLSTCRFECTSGIPYLIYGLKLEKGNKATDWTPAPEDIDNSIMNTVTDKINSLQIGGRNLALKTSSSYSIPYSSFDGDQNKCPKLATVLTDGLKVGDTVTVRLLYKYTDIVAANGKTAICSIQGYGNVTEWNSGCFYGSDGLVLTGSGEHEFLYSFKVIADHLKNSAWIVDIRHDWIQSGSVQWKSFKVEKGDKATDWSPAPEDIDSAIHDRVIYARGTGCDYLNNRILRIGKKTIYDDTGRGVRVTALDPATLEIRSDDIYDLHVGGHHETNFVNKINELNEGYYIIVVTSWDNAYLHWGVRCEALYKIGGFAPNPSLNAYREAYALIGKSGLGKGNGIEMYIPRTDQDHRHAEVSVKVGQNGEFVGVNSPNLGHQIDTIDTKVETTKNRVSEIATSLDGINLKVQSTEQTVTNHTTQLNQVDSKIDNAKNQAINSSREILDTRGTNETPEWYITHYGHQSITEFKLGYIIGLTGIGFGTVETKVPWGDPSGGLPVQTFRSFTTPTYERKGTSLTQWGEWIQIEDIDGAQNKANTAQNNANNYTNGQIAVVNQTISDRVAEIKLTTDSITQRVESSETRINTLQIGGRNLFLKSDIDKYGIGNWSNNGNGTGIVEGTYIDGTKTIKIVGGEGISYNSYIKLKRNTEYIYSMMIKSSSALNVGTSNPLHMWISEVDNGSGHNEIILSHSENISANTWTKAYIVFKTPNTQDVYYMKPFIYGIGDNTVYISKVQVEEGNKATDWSPAPEDIISEISDVNSKVAEVKVTADSIVQKVSKTEQIAMIPQDSKMLNTDPTFYNGDNNVWVYNNNNNGAVSVSRVIKSNDCPTTSGYMLEITTNGSASPYLGGITFATWTRANAVYVTRLIAKLPEGSWLSWHTNQIGDGGYSEWLTDNKGTGTWKEYLCKVVCGSSGQFHNTNYFALVNAANPVTWHVAFATVYDITETNGLETRISNAEQKITDSAIINTVSSTINNKVNTALNDLKIGGRNLAKKSATLNDSFSELNSFKGTRTILDDSSAKCGKVIKIECTTAGSGFYFGIWNGDASCVGKQFTWSFDVKMNKNRTLGSVGHEKGGVTTISATTEWTKVHHTWTYSKDGYSAFICYPNFDSGDIIYIRDFKIEEGSKATDWTPAPEDIDSAINDIDDKVTTTINKVAELKLTADSITQRVESNENTVSGLTANLNNLKIGGRNLAFKNAVSAFGASSINLDNYIKRGDITVWKPDGEYNGGFHFDKLLGYKPETRYVVQFYMTCTEHTIRNIHFHNGQNIIKSDVYVDDVRIGTIAEVINTSIFDDGKTHKVRMEYTTPAALVDSSGGTNQTYFQPNKTIADPYTIFIQEFKVEEGNKATTWTPAPEDIENSINTVNSKLAELKLEADSITQRVQSTENNLSNLQIGGRNLCTGTKDWSNWDNGSNTTLTDEYYQGFRIYTSDSEWAYRYQDLELEADTDYTISCWVKTNVAGTKVGCYVWHGDGEGIITLNEVDKWVRYTFTKTNLSKRAYRIRIESSNSINGAKLYLCGFKLEKGNKATDWSPAPEDIDSDINNVDNKVTTTISKLAEIKLTTDSITQRVESSEQIINNKEDKKSRYIFAKGTGNDYYANSYVEVEGRCLTDGQGRGLRIHALNPETLNCFFIQDYDTFASDDAVNSFNAKINELNAGYHIIIVTSLDASYPWRCKESLRKIGGSLLPDTTDTYREAYALIGKSGLGQGNGVEMYIPKTADDKRHAEVSVKIGQKGEFMGVNHSNSVSQIEILKNEIGLKVQKNNVISSINLYTQDDENGSHSGVKIQGDKIDLQGQVTFSSLADSNVSGSIKNIFTQQDNQTVINGGMIKTHTIKGNDLLLKGNMSVTDNSGNKTFEITDAGEVNIQARSLRIGSSNVATNNDISNAVNNLQVGGVNLLINSSFTKNADQWYSQAAFVIEDDKPCAKLTGAFNSTVAVRQSILDKLVPNQQYTVSGWVKLKNITFGNTNPVLMYYVDGAYNGNTTWYGYGSYEFDRSITEWQYVTWTFTTDDKLKTASSCYFFVYCRDFIGDVFFYNLKLEKGNKSTDWTAASEDKVDNNQEAIFNKLFSNGQQGFVLENGKVYINGEVIRANAIRGSVISAINMSSEYAKINSAQIGNIDASKITTGFISANRLDASTLVSKINGGYTSISGDKIRTGIIRANSGGSYIDLDDGTMQLGSTSRSNYLQWNGSTLKIKGHLDTCTFRGKNMVYIEDDGILSCDGTTYIRHLSVLETHPGWAYGTRGSFDCAPTANFQKEVRTEGEFWARNNSGEFLGVIRRGAYKSGVIQIDRMRVINSAHGSANNYIEVACYNSNHVFGIDLWSSDKKLKENIVSIEDNNASLLNDDTSKTGLDLINNLNHYSFDYKKSFGGDHVSCGYAAQELQELNDSLVMEVEQQDGTTLLQPKTSNIIPNLSLAIKQQQKMIEDLKAEIEELKSKLNN